MERTWTIVQLSIALFLIGSVHAKPLTERPFRNERVMDFVKTSPYSLFFDPKENGIRSDKQKVDYDLTKKSRLRVGPYVLDQSSVQMNMSIEQGEFYDLEFGLDWVKKRGSVYVISFEWPKDYIHQGTIEIINDSGKSLWRRALTKEDQIEWGKIKSGDVRSTNEEGLAPKTPPNERPSQLSKIHQQSQFGLAHRSFHEIPLATIVGPFRYCLTEDQTKSRMALCSRRYEFIREAGRYRVKELTKKVEVKVMINDRSVNDRGTAVFLDLDVPLKFSAILENGTYFEIVSHPKEFKMVDMVLDRDTKMIHIIGYGDTPFADVEETFQVDSMNWGFLNFMPTIGDLRKFWRAKTPLQAPYIYLKGEGGIPFRQNFEFDDLPGSKARLVLLDTTTKSTYSSNVWVRGKVHPEVKLKSEGTEVERVSPTDFRWKYRASEAGKYNRDTLIVEENGKKFIAGYEIYRGFSSEISARTSGIITSGLQFVILGEVAFQHWFESLLWMENYYLSKQRWGIAGRYFNLLAGTENTRSGNSQLKQLSVGNADLKYRFTPGVWGKDPSVGLIAGFQNLDYGFEDSQGDITFHVPTLGGGVFWTRSMPKVFDDFFNILPFMRYPKWVDWEFIYYPVTLREKQTSLLMFAINFHGKVQWTPRFYGEGGFGFKSISFQDKRSADTNNHLGIVTGAAYGTIGVGMNF